VDAFRDDKPPSARNELSGVVHGPAVQARDVHGDIHLHAAPREIRVPRCLPPRPAAFVDREPLLERFTAFRADSVDGPLVIVISGPGGVGKTALALHWLHSVADEYEHGQLFYDLADDAGGPVTAERVLPAFLRDLGVEPGRVPADVAEQAARYRSITADRRIAVFLDNAVTAGQLRHLLPATTYSTVVVTSRWRLSGLVANGARPVLLDALDDRAARELLAVPAGDRAMDDTQSLATLAALCGRMPLALRIVGGQLAEHPRRSLARTVARLADENRRLSALTAEDLSVRTGFELSYRELPPAAARLFRLAGLHPGRDFGVAAAAALADLDEDTAEELLDVLLRANLVIESGDDRFQLHDLLRLYARECAERDETPDESDAALRRVIDWYLAAAAAADLTLMPGRWRLGPAFATAHPLAGKAAAWAWLERERENLRAAVVAAHARQWDERVWWLCEALWYLYFLRKYYADWDATHRLGVAAAVRCGDRRAEGRMRCQLGFALIGQGRLDEAAAEFTAARAADRAAGHRRGEATALESLGLLGLRRSQYDQAVDALEANLEIAEELGEDRRAILLARHHLGRARSAAGDQDAAFALLRQLPDDFAELPDVYNQARALTSLGEAWLRARQPRAAEELLGRALEIMRAEGAREQQADVLVLLAEAAGQTGDAEAQRIRRAAAKALYEEIGSPRAGEM
jgi:tetratricopeptide (TPR) repeat protein